MKRSLVLASLFTIACYGSQQSACETGSGPSPTPTPTATPSPSPTPTPTPLAVNDCGREFADVDFLFLGGPSTLPVGERGRYDLTPKQFCTENGSVKVRDVPDHFNEPKASSVGWSVEGDRQLGTIVPDGFAAYFTRRVGLGGTSGVAPVTIRVDFEGKFAQKVIQ